MKLTNDCKLENLQTKGTSLLLSMILMLTLNVSAHAEDIGMKLAKDRSLPGKNKIGECAAYADALFAKMNSAGVEAYRVSFDWQNYSLGSQSGAHAVVVFRDVRGRYYAADNMTWKPLWLKGNNSSEWATFIAGMDTGTSVRNTIASNAAKVSKNTAYARAD